MEPTNLRIPTPSTRPPFGAGEADTDPQPNSPQPITPSHAPRRRRIATCGQTTGEHPRSRGRNRGDSRRAATNSQAAVAAQTETERAPPGLSYPRGWLALT